MRTFTEGLLFLKLKNTISFFFSTIGMRESIAAGARLEATLIWLANGGSYSALKYHTRISQQSLSIIVPETCSAIFEALKDDYMKVSMKTRYLSNIYIIDLFQIFACTSQMINFPFLFVILHAYKKQLNLFSYKTISNHCRN